MARRTALSLIALLMSTTLVAHAQLPDPPSEDRVRDMVEQIRLTAAGRTSVETRERISGYITQTAEDLDADEPTQARLTHHSGTILIVRGYPWEGLWALATAAQANWVHPDTLNNIGFALSFVDDHDRAEAILLYTTHTWPEFSPGWTNLARIYLDEGDDELAGEALDRAEEAEPGAAVNEELRGRWAIMRDDRAAAADALVDLAGLDPDSPLLDDLRDFVRDEDITRERRERLDAVPMPVHFIRLEEPIEDYEDFVLDEFTRRYWASTAEVYGRLGASTDYATTELPPGVFEQLPPEMQATLRSLGYAPGDEVDVLRPADSRANYLRLSQVLKYHQERYLARMREIYREGEVARIHEAERQRQREYHEELLEQLEAGADPQAARNAWMDRSITSMEARQPAWLAAMQSARLRGNRITREYWLTVASLIADLPEDWRDEEVRYLQKQAALSNLNHSGEVCKWVALGQRAVILNREATIVAADALHAAAAAREREAEIARSEHEEEWEEELLRQMEGPDFNTSDWVGLNLGVFSVKIQEDQIGLSGGEVLVGDASFNWESVELEMGVGLGVSTPALGPTPIVGGVGASGKVLGVVRFGGGETWRVGVREHVQGSVGTAVFGRDIDVVNHYDWLASSGSL